MSAAVWCDCFQHFANVQFLRREIRKYQSTTETLIRRAPLQRLVREVADYVRAEDACMAWLNLLHGHSLSPV